MSEYKKMKNTINDEDRYYSYTFDKALSILNALPVDPEVLKLNKTITMDTVAYDLCPSFTYLVNNKVSPVAKNLKKFLSYPPNRNRYYDELNNIGKLDAFPSDMKKQKLLAEGDIYLAMDDEYEISKLEFIEERKMDYNGQRQRFFIFKVYYSEDTYFGMAGPYPLNDNNLISRGTKTGINYKEYSSKSVAEHINDLLEQDK